MYFGYVALFMGGENFKQRGRAARRRPRLLTVAAVEGGGGRGEDGSLSFRPDDFAHLVTCAAVRVSRKTKEWSSYLVLFCIEYIQNST